MAKIIVTVQFVADSYNYCGTPEEYRNHLLHVGYVRKLPSDDIIEDFEVIAAKIIPEGSE